MIDHSYDMAADFKRDHFFGPWTKEDDAKAEFDRRIAASGLFRSLSEVAGCYTARRPDREDKDARIDRILIPSRALRDKGWVTNIGVEIKASETKLGHALAQAEDYTHCLFRIILKKDNGDPDSITWQQLPHIFLWPLQPQLGTVASVMVQNRIGCLYDSKHSPLIFQLERQVIRLNDDGNLIVNQSVSGTKKGSR